MSVLSWAFARYYDRMLADAENKCLNDWRAQLLSNLSGKVLEIGCGTGLNLAHYPQSLDSLVLTEPDPHMRKKLYSVVSKKINCHWQLLGHSAEHIPLAANSFDAVVSTLVLCSVDNQQQALTELYRLLRPQGKLIFIEHVIASNRLRRIKWQRWLEPFWHRVFCGCHLTRHSEQAIMDAGFIIEQIERQSMRGVPPVVRPSIRGVAIKP